MRASLRFMSTLALAIIMSVALEAEAKKGGKGGGANPHGGSGKKGHKPTIEQQQKPTKAKAHGLHNNPDKDGNGVLSAQERKVYENKSRAAFQMHASGRKKNLTRAQYEAMGSEFKPGTFAKVDADGNGFISSQEYIAARNKPYLPSEP